VEVVGKLDPAQLAFARGNVYKAGGSKLRQIEGVHPLDTIAPWAPDNLKGKTDEQAIHLYWDRNMEPDVKGYNIYRSVDSLGSYKWINEKPVQDTLYKDSDVEDNTIYYYKVTATDEAENESGYSNILSSQYISTAVEPEEHPGDLDVRVYPNPSDGRVTLELNWLTRGYVEVYSILGKKVYKTRLNSQRKILNLSHHRPGIYLIKTHASGFTFVRRIILQ
jgi:fibronectin type 3 domain-containing protein